MCNICDDFKNKKINSKEAFERIGTALKDQSDSEKTGHLIELSATILDEDVPMTERDEDIEEKWQNENSED